MDRNTFNTALRDLLINIHDYVALERNLLGDIMPRSSTTQSRAEALRHWVHQGIETLRPAGEKLPADAPEWRYYRILSSRYIEGAVVLEVQRRLSLGERQERRLHSRAVDALEEVLWHDLFPTADIVSEPAKEGLGSGDSDFQLSLEPIRLERLVEEVAAISEPRVQAAGGKIQLDFPPNLPQILADRIILRQILLTLISRAVQLRIKGTLNLSGRLDVNGVSVEIQVETDHALEQPYELLSTEQLRYWLDRLNARLTDETAAESGSIINRMILYLPRANQLTLLVVDDHEPAIRIIQRYLSNTNIQIVGVTDPQQVIPLAKSTLPHAILLDVMMPTIDGWEILQSLKSDPELRDIQVIICSVWDQPDLAFSLGANDFLKKPIRQAELMGALARLGLLEPWDESSRADS